MADQNRTPPAPLESDLQRRLREMHDHSDQVTGFVAPPLPGAGYTGLALALNQVNTNK
jgi:hypothetical protein